MNRLIIISEIMRDVAQVFFASVAIAPIMSGVINIRTFSAGILFSLVLWLLSIIIIKQ